MKNRKRIVITVILLFLCLVAVAGILMYDRDQDSSKGKSTASQIPDEESIYFQGEEYRRNPDIQTILLLGVDKEKLTDMNGNPGENGQSDSINLLVTDVDKKTGQILQISRDTMVDIEIYSIEGEKLTSQTGQIALQYAYGDGKEKSCYLTADRVSELLYGISIRNFLSLTIEGIQTATDCLGGVTLTVPEDYTYIDPAFQKGAILTFSGDMAEKYVRARNTTALESNEERMERQDQFMGALIGKISRIDRTESMLSLYHKLQQYMVTNVTAERWKELSEYRISDEILKLPGTVREGKDGYAEVVPNEEKLREMIIHLFYEKV